MKGRVLQYVQHWLTAESGRENFCPFSHEGGTLTKWVFILGYSVLFISFPKSLKQKIMLRDRCWLAMSGGPMSSDLSSPVL